MEWRQCWTVPLPLHQTYSLVRIRTISPSINFHLMLIISNCHGITENAYHVIAYRIQRITNLLRSNTSELQAKLFDSKLYFRFVLRAMKKYSRKWIAINKFTKSNKFTLPWGYQSQLITIEILAYFRFSILVSGIINSFQPNVSSFEFGHYQRRPATIIRLNKWMYKFI